MIDTTPQPLPLPAWQAKALHEGRASRITMPMEPQPPEFPGWWVGLHWASERHFQRGAHQHAPYPPGTLLAVLEEARPSGEVYVYSADQQVIRLDLPEDPGAPVETMIGRDPIHDRRPIPAEEMPLWTSRTHLLVTECRPVRLGDMPWQHAHEHGVRSHSAEAWDGRSYDESVRKGYLLGFRKAWDEQFGDSHPWSPGLWAWTLTVERTNREGKP